MSPISPFAMVSTLNFTGGVPLPPNTLAGTSKNSPLKYPVPAVVIVTLSTAFPDITTVNSAPELPVVLCVFFDTNLNLEVI